MTVEKGSNMNHQQQPFEVSIDTAGSKCFDDDGRLKRTGKFILLLYTFSFTFKTYSKSSREFSSVGKYIQSKRENH